MATERDLMSDSDDVFVTEVSEQYLGYLTSRVIHYLSNKSSGRSAQILHVRGQPTKMVLNLGSNSGANQPSVKVRPSNMIFVKNVPSNYDEEHLEMFFAYKKGQGGGPVKSVTLNRKGRSAVVEFEEEDAVKTVISKRPIQILGNKLDIDVHSPYLENDETLRTVALTGLPTELVEDIRNMQLDYPTGTGEQLMQREVHVGDQVRLLKDTMCTHSFGYEYTVKKGANGIVLSVDSTAARISFSAKKNEKEASISPNRLLVIG